MDVFAQQDNHNLSDRSVQAAQAAVRVAHGWLLPRVATKWQEQQSKKVLCAQEHT